MAEPLRSCNVASAERPAWRQLAKTSAAHSADRARHRVAVDSILSPPDIHFYNVHGQFWNQAPYDESECSQILARLPIATTMIVSELQASAEQLRRKVIGCTAAPKLLHAPQHERVIGAAKSE